MDRSNPQGKTDCQNCLVAGGLGLLGYEIAKQLYSAGKKVRILDMAEPEGLDEKNFEFFHGDIRDIENLKRAFEGIEVVFQTAAAVWDPKTPPSVYDEVNVNGNKNVIETCIERGVKKLIYTSTLDVVVDGKKPVKDGDESLNYPEKMPHDNYSRTKIIAEQMILKANSESLLTCSLRPVGMYGPRDKYHIANIIRAAKSGADFKLGNGTAKFSHVYSENAAYAHILAAEKLYPGSPVAGNFYFITDDWPAENLFTFMEPFLEGLGFRPPARSIPYRLAYFLAYINEKFNPSSNFNRFAVIQTCVDHTFKSIRAENDLGYVSIVSKEEAFQKTLDWFKKNIDKI